MSAVRTTTSGRSQVAPVAAGAKRRVSFQSKAPTPDANFSSTVTHTTTPTSDPRVARRGSAKDITTTAYKSKRTGCTVAGGTATTQVLQGLEKRA